MKRHWSSYPSLLLAGLALGWMTGLSVSPILPIIVTAFVSLVVAITAALAGMEIHDSEDSSAEPRRPPTARRKLAHVSVLPVGLLAVSLAVGSVFGVYARTNEWFGIEPKRAAARWKDAGLDEKQVVQRLFDNIYAPASSKAGEDKKGAGSKESQGQESSAGKQNPHFSIVFAASSDECTSFLSSNDAQLRGAMMQDEKNKSVQKLAEIVKNPADLKAMVKELCSQH
jgi:hypothetical protein